MCSSIVGNTTDFDGDIKNSTHTVICINNSNVFLTDFIHLKIHKQFPRHD